MRRAKVGDKVAVIGYIQAIALSSTMVDKKKQPMIEYHVVLPRGWLSRENFEVVPKTKRKR